MAEVKEADKNPMWKGDAVGYTALHEWVKNHKVQPFLCEICNKEPSVDLANISGEYNRDISDWEYLCRRCHMAKDGRSARLRDMGIAKTILYAFNGESLSIRAWSEKTGLPIALLRTRLSNGKWSIDEALTTKSCGNKRRTTASKIAS